MSDSETTARDLWQALSGELRAFLRSRLPSDADADDLLQDVFLRIIENLPSLRQPGRIEPWVYQIARNAIADFYRRRTPSSESVDDLVESSHDESDNNQNLAVGAWLSSMIDALPTTLQDAVRFYEIEGVAQAEVANRLSITLSGAKSRVQRGRRRLAELLHSNCRLALDGRGNIVECAPASVDSCMKVLCECDEPRAVPAD